jgi:hypothetical protein
MLDAYCAPSFLKAVCIRNADSGEVSEISSGLHEMLALLIYFPPLTDLPSAVLFGDTHTTHLPRWCPPPATHRRVWGDSAARKFDVSAAVPYSRAAPLAVHSEIPVRSGTVQAHQKGSCPCVSFEFVAVSR